MAPERLNERGNDGSSAVGASSAKSKIHSGTPPAVSRRIFLTTAALGLGAVCAAPLLAGFRRRHFSGSIVGGNYSLGHALRDGKLPAVSETAETGIVIIGGGISGLSAARRLRQ